MESDVVDDVIGVTNALVKFGSVWLAEPKAFCHGIMLTDLHHALLWQHNPSTPRARRSLPTNGVHLGLLGHGLCGVILLTTCRRYVGIDNGPGEPLGAETLVDPWYIVDYICSLTFAGFPGSFRFSRQRMWSPYILLRKGS